MLARIKLNSIESKIFESLMNDEISHEDFMATINEAKKYWEPRESIRIETKWIVKEVKLKTLI